MFATLGLGKPWTLLGGSLACWLEKKDAKQSAVSQVLC